MKTIAEVANILGVSRQAINKHAQKLPAELKIFKGRQIFLTDDGADRIIQIVTDNLQLQRRQPVKLTGCALSTGPFSSTVDTVNETQKEPATDDNEKQQRLTEYEKQIEELKEELKAARDETKQEREARSVESDFFRRALEERDQQVDKLLDRVADLTQTLASTSESLKAAQALQAMTMQQLEAPKPEPKEDFPEEFEEPKGFFSIFRRKKRG